LSCTCKNLWKPRRASARTYGRVLVMVYALQTLVQSSRITPAPLWRVALACLLDALLLAAGIGVTIMLFRRDFLTAVIIAAWLTLALIVWQAVALVRT